MAVAFDRFGDEILMQRKLCPMRVAEGGTDVPGGAIEDIEGDSRIELTATPLGLLALGIWSSRQHFGLDRHGRDRGVGPMQGLGSALVRIEGRFPTHRGHEHETGSDLVP